MLPWSLMNTARAQHTPLNGRHAAQCASAPREARVVTNDPATSGQPQSSAVWGNGSRMWRRTSPLHVARALRTVGIDSACMVSINALCRRMQVLVCRWCCTCMASTYLPYSPSSRGSNRRVLIPPAPAHETQELRTVEACTARNSPAWPLSRKCI